MNTKINKLNFNIYGSSKSLEFYKRRFEMRLSIIIAISLLYAGCSTKNLSNNSAIKINQDGGLLFYAYMENGNELSRISKEQIKVKNKEEIIRVYKNGYYPIYLKMSSTCGYNVMGFVRSGDVMLCKSNYIEMDSPIASGIASVIALPIGLVNSSIGGSAVLVDKSFSASLFEKAIISSGLPRVKSIISSDLTVLDMGVLSKTDISNIRK